MICVATTLAGKPCRGRGERMVGGLMVCKYHIGWASRLWVDVRDRLPADVRIAAERDTCERNILRLRQD